MKNYNVVVKFRNGDGKVMKEEFGCEHYTLTDSYGHFKIDETHTRIVIYANTFGLEVEKIEAEKSN